GGDDEGRAARERGDQAGRDEEVRVDDVRSEAARSAAGGAGELEVAALAAGASVENGELELVAARLERAFGLGDERAEVGIVGPGIHLRDEQDPHAAQYPLRLLRRHCPGGPTVTAA